MPQRVKDLALSLQQLQLLLWGGFDPWLRNFPMPRARQKEKKKKEMQFLPPDGPQVELRSIKNLAFKDQEPGSSGKQGDSGQ